MLSASQPQPILLANYTVPSYLVLKTDLTFDLYDEETRVTALLTLQRNPEAAAGVDSLVLQGSELVLESIALDNRTLTVNEYTIVGENLTLTGLPEQLRLRIVTRIKPHLNTSLEGLYQSRGLYCTQCEAEGFRKITWYPDRPDVMSEFTTRITADRQRYPVLLSNGNLVEQGELDSGRHFAVWHDPFKKPAYLFALVAGDLSFIENHFVTRSGRDVTLRIYVEAKDLDKCDHAMDSLKNSMRWDEDVYGREYDLDIFMIVAVDDFNMGAMENKGLNIFNTSCVLAKPETTTDAGFQRVEAVVAHEYFHNWSGNRVTCRDWFQLSLKEGFTVYRDAEFSADMGSRTVKRIEDVALLRTLQFAEDAGPMAHAVRPASYIEISNFYTLTIYEKGAELVRMLATLLGAEKFREGSDLYFDRHDGQAATTDDFVQAMADVSGRDLSQFKRWYSQAGTPRLEVTDHYDEDAQEYHLNFRQSCPPTPENTNKQPFHIPIKMGLLGAAGDLPLRLKGYPVDTETSDNTSMVLELTDAEQTFVFQQVHEKPVPSLLRGFSAPVKWHYDWQRDDLITLMSRDSDGFNRWEASQQLALRVLHQLLQEASLPTVSTATEDDITALMAALNSVVADETLDPAMVAYMLTLPSEAYLSELAEVIDVDGIHRARHYLQERIALALKPTFVAIYQRYDHQQAYRADARGIAERSLKNTALHYLSLLGDESWVETCYEQYRAASNMTDAMAALTRLVNTDNPLAATLAENALENFYQCWQQEPLVVNQWFAVQAACVLPGTLEQVKKLQKHPAFDGRNPNKIRALISAFCNNNAVNFHRLDAQQQGPGYRFLADEIIRLNRQNPQMASRLLTPLTKWRKYDPVRQTLMKAELQRILQEDLSRDVYEVVSKSLAEA